MRILNIPFIKGLESMASEEIETAMELSGAKTAVDSVNWPEEWPYCPSVHAIAARSASHLFVFYHVRGLDLRAQALEYNGPVWEDSCCEFFISDPKDGTYYNFEMNCIGTLLAAKRKSRTDCRHFDASVLDNVIRYSSLQQKRYDIGDKMFSWEVAMGIPFGMIGLDGRNLPEKVRANFFKCADKAAHPHFLSWNPIDVPSPDFHRPDFFGELRF